MMKKFSACSPKRTQGAPVPEPEKPRAGMSQKAEIQSPPDTDVAWMPCGETVAMKIDMPGFITEDELAHFRDGLVAYMPANHAVIARAHDLDDE